MDHDRSASPTGLVVSSATTKMDFIGYPPGRAKPSQEQPPTISPMGRTPVHASREAYGAPNRVGKKQNTIFAYRRLSRSKCETIVRQILRRVNRIRGVMPQCRRGVTSTCGLPRRANALRPAGDTSAILELRTAIESVERSQVSGGGILRASASWQKVRVGGVRQAER